MQGKTSGKMPQQQKHPVILDFADLEHLFPLYTESESVLFQKGCLWLKVFTNPSFMRKISSPLWPQPVGARSYTYQLWWRRCMWWLLCGAFCRRGRRQNEDLEHCVELKHCLLRPQHNLSDLISSTVLDAQNKLSPSSALPLSISSQPCAGFSHSLSSTQRLGLLSGLVLDSPLLHR
ncbi:hypothetical protein NPIL_426321 [Nephila pilipes]|uniref:Uncharacterized protein n=1 Tax=Nephila pilipes TaxID=299642 RepID=A0A8X6NDR9_NEPPI|nr:hypothetical protein NPIL_426321 [Nephila pilipes]